MSRIFGIGETILDIVFENDMPVSALPGGSTFNAMISLGRSLNGSGVPVTMITEVGDDHTGDIISSFMEDNGVRTSAVTRNKGTKSHISLAFLDEKRNAQYEFYKDHASAFLKEDLIDGIDFEKGDLVLFGSFFAVNPQIRKTVKSLLDKAASAGAILYYDVNFRKNHIADLPYVMQNIEENIALSDFVRGSDEDFKYLYGLDSPESVYERHIKTLCRNFICTCGSRPVKVFSGSCRYEFEAPQVEVVSTIGAGDNFNAGFLYGLVSKNLSRGNCHSLDAEGWKSLIGSAESFASESCRSIENYIGKDFVSKLG